tara:strand:- start:1541 stop:1882 length:342 start_codon:yes stop_codon:yes gene_type:complete
MPLNKLICQEWELQGTSYSGKISVDAFTGEEFSDIAFTTKCIRVYGTKDQLTALSKKYDIDEVYDYKVERKGSYWYNIYRDPEKTNKEVKQKLKEYKILYKLNNNKPLILRIK